MEPTTIGITSHRSWVFYVVADVGLPGTNGSHRPLAVTYRQGHGPGPCRNGSRSEQRVLHVVEDCARIIDILTDPANRVALEAELAAAIWYYRGPHYSEPDRVDIPDAPQPGFDFSPWRDNWVQKPASPERPELPWPGGTREFPFVSSCLRLALHRDDAYGTRLGDVQEQSLATAFRGDQLEYGMVVVDISDLDSISYGIIDSKVSYVVDIDLSINMGWDAVESPRPDREPVIQLEESRPRLPLSGTRYMKKYGLYHPTAAMVRLRKKPVVKPTALHYIWPRRNPRFDSGLEAGRINLAPPTGQDAALDQVVTRMIQDAIRYDRLDIEIHRESINHPSFQTRLLIQLRDDPARLGGGSESSAQLLRLAYAGHSHLNWVAYTNLTYVDMVTALQSAELRDARALSICVDHINGSPMPLLETLARSETIRDLCFLQRPARTNDDKTSQLFAHICASPSTSGLLHSRNIFLTCAFSAPLRRKFWLPDPKTSGLRYTYPVRAFPVQHMFVRQQFTGSADDDGDEIKKFRPCHFFLGDALLKPERLVSGFFQYCRSVLTDRFLFSFAAAPSNLSRHSHEEDGFSRTSISPIPAENFAISERCSVSSATATGDGHGETQVECWPMFRPLEPDSWVLLVSHEWHTSPAMRRQRAELLSQGRSGDSALGSPFVRYAFLRARKPVPCPNPAGVSSEALVSPEYIQVVGGAKEFLRETAPDVDERLVGARFDETVRILRERWSTLGDLGPGMDFISLLDDSAARSVLKDFLEDGLYIRENLKAAMKAMPGERNWYPQLLTGSSRYNLRSQRRTAQAAVGPTRRNGAVFKSLYDPDVQVQNPIGTQRPVTPPQEDDDFDL